MSAPQSCLSLGTLSPSAAPPERTFPSCCKIVRESIRFHVCEISPSSSKRWRSQNVVSIALPVGGTVECVVVTRHNNRRFGPMKPKSSPVVGVG
jgi:hypothetical protein